MIEKRRIWTDEALADYIRDELGFPGARQGAMVEKEAVDIATGEVSRERWYLLTSLSSRRCGPKELLRVLRNHWSAPNSLHHVKDRSWDEDVHMLRRPGLGEVFATLVNTGLNALRLEGWFSLRMSMPLRAKTCAFRPTQTIARLDGKASCLCNRPGVPAGIVDAKHGVKFHQQCQEPQCVWVRVCKTLAAGACTQWLL